MDTPKIDRLKPYLVEVVEGKRYLWCTCGRSNKQPFCDGSHRDTIFKPFVWTAERSEEKLFCACKHTKQSPFCDGTHNSLSDKYAEAEDGDGANVELVDYVQAEGGALVSSLDNGCYVMRLPEAAMSTIGDMQIYPVINDATGADKLSQYSAIVKAGRSPIMRFAESDVVLFIASGNGRVEIAANSFAVSPETGVCVKPGEGFQVINENDEPICLSISACPQCPAPEYLDEMPAFFDDTVPERIQGVDESKQEPMADRFYQVLIGEETHKTPVTLFIGEIPLSRAAHHRHLYEETITVLAGEGFMWTDETKTPVQPGDTIYLPLKQAHSLECTTPDGMRLLGLFYPSMSPAINY